MVNTRSGSLSSPPTAPAPPSATKKRAAETESPESTPAKKRGRPSKKQATPTKLPAEKKQKTIEDTMDVNAHAKDGDSDEVKNNGVGNEEQLNDEEPRSNKAVKDGMGATEESHNQKVVDESVQDVDTIEDDSEVAEQIKDEDSNPEESKEEEFSGAKNGTDLVKADATEVKKDVEMKQDSATEKITENNESVIENSKREAAIPSSILEKGIIYFFFRGRVNIEEPQGIEDVARSYIVLRPLPIGSKLGDGPLEDSGNARLLTLPKKMLPKSTNDRFLMFTEKVNSSIEDVRKQFAQNEYATKTSGTSNTPSATPFAEGVYAITSTGRESHLAYILTKPSTIGEVQIELGLHEKGSYVVSAKNPEAPGPANATISNPAKYPDELQKKFRGLRWMPLVPELLDYEGTQFLVIGEGLGNFGRAVEEMDKDKEDESKEKPEDELEKLEEEDHDRVEHLKEDDPVFADLGLSSKEYLKIQTKW